MISKVAVALLTAAVAMAQNTTAPESPLVAGDISWVMMSSAMVFIQIPGLGLFYSGLTESKNSLSILLSVLLCFCVVLVQWVLFGYSLAFSDTSSSSFIGNFEYAALINTMDTENAIASTVPNSLLAMYQMMFACITPGLFIGGVAGRMRLLPMMVFVLLWTTFVYDPIAYWSWSANGWLHTLNCMDYAGGSVVHLSSGVTGFVLAIMLGKRVDYGTREYKPHNPTFVYIGTALLLFGWNGFNGGSALASNQRAAGAAFATNIAAGAGGLTMMALESFVNKKRFSAIAFCNGVVIALVAITPGSGFVQPVFGLLFGFLTSFVCFYAGRLVHYFKVDDCLDVAASHAVGGAFGMILTGIFAQSEITTIAASPAAPAGWLSGAWIQVPIQLAGIASVAAWTAVCSVVLVLLINCIPGLKMRCHKEAEIMGLDAYEVGEDSYPYIAVPTVTGAESIKSDTGSVKEASKLLCECTPHSSQVTLANGLEIV
ncbi:ammonium transporter AmtB-like domain-containing protein [Obelidium mucronatum]|nr:ammonium transporter AmtB-like domain-containing protein [Obelidium mucronatum]